jgi:hypothetical protein
MCYTCKQTLAHATLGPKSPAAVVGGQMVKVTAPLRSTSKVANEHW